MTEKTQDARGVQDALDAPDAQGPQNVALRVVRGEPSPEELVALVAVLAARSAQSAAVTEGQAAEAPRPTSGWTDRARYVRSGRQDFGARSGWRAAALPS